MDNRISVDKKIQNAEQIKRQRLVEQLQSTGVIEQFVVNGKPVEIKFKVSEQCSVRITAGDASESIGSIMVKLDGVRAIINSKKLDEKYQKVGIMSKAQSFLAEALINQGVATITGTIEEWNTASLRSRFLMKSISRGGFYVTTAHLESKGNKKEYRVTTFLSRVISDPETAYRNVVKPSVVQHLDRRKRR